MNELYKKTTSMVIVIMILLSFLPSIVFADDQLKKIGVIDFKDLSQGGPLGEMAADSLTVDLVKINTCQVIERRKLKSILQEQFLGMTGTIDSNTATQVGKILGLDYILTGSIEGGTNTRPGYFAYNSKTKSNYWVPESHSSSTTLNTNLIDIKTGQVVWSTQTTGSDPSLADALSWAVYDAVRNLYSFIPIQGYIIKTDADRYYIDLGREKNILLKDRFIVTHEGEAIIHPKTGKLIKEQIIAGELEVTQVMDGMAIAVRVHDDNNQNIAFSVGDTITRKLKDKPGRFLNLFGSREHVY